MKPYYEDNHIRIFNKDCRSMDELPDNSVQCVVTSPPYFGLRKYSGEQELIWGGQDCEHEWGAEVIVPRQSNPDTGLANTGTGAPSTRLPGLRQAGERSQSGGHFCSLCGAWKGGLGQEPTMDLYIQHLIEIMREIKRVLRNDGTFFLNLGDSYATHASGGKGYAHNFRAPEVAIREGIDQPKPTAKSIGLKEKDLCLIPFRVAIAAQEDGWWVRSIIIWSKPNPMPESINGWRWSKHRIKVKGKSGKYWASNSPHQPTEWEDCPGCPKCSPNDGYVLRKGSWRPTTSHEYILMLTKTDTYYCDADAVRELINPNNTGKVAVRPSGDSKTRDKEHWGVPHESKQVIREYETIKGANLRSVWTFPTVPFPSFKIDGKKVDHFAVFPEKLPELCIKAATPEGCCSKCGAPWARVGTRPSR
ncbi:site-specific DNA-methyltransferase, partial [Patescibacteria group bacterium]|nr:site-specific DNA-methyltransferase [Patescibacteria group bacterium]